MKPQILLFYFLALFILPALSQHKIENNIFSYLQENALVLNEGGILQEPNEIQKYVQSLVKTNKTTYEKQFSIEVNSKLDYEAGDLQIGPHSYSVMFLKQKEENSPEIEFLVIFEKAKSTEQRPAIDLARTEWMKHCNAHRAAELVSQLYTSDAYYYSRGGLMQGTESITTEYGYMNNPNYSLKLTPKYVTFVSDDIAFEIGRCSGSYPNPYMLLWEKQSGGKWQVLMDTNY